ncbi:MAG: hypothetical protein PHN37_01480 [Candidatus Pacebacteria bacterium]|nr:hypothetical protein [Candidatus Paceibacterota bacterium]
MVKKETKKIFIIMRFGLIVIAIIILILIVETYKNTNVIPQDYLTALNVSNNGYGYDIYDQKVKRYQPMAQTLIISAEANRYIYTKDKAAFKSVIQNADWLVKNKDINNNNIIGWGLPTSFDAFGDNSENPPNTEYTITTALAVKGLLDAVDVVDKSNIIIKFLYKSKKETYLKVSQEALDSFIENKFYTQNPDGTIFFWYSSQKSDAQLVTNCHAMFVGILQRISNYFIDKEKKTIYQDLADKGMKYLLETKIEKEGAWYWIYYPRAKEPHEDHGVHAAYTSDGLLMYKKNDGRLSSKIDEQKILNGLKLYIKDGRILEMFSVPERVPRSWDLGYFLYVMSEYFPQEEAIKNIIYNNILSRQETDGFRLYDDKNTPTDFVRYNAHILLGLSKYFWNEE